MTRDYRESEGGSSQQEMDDHVSFWDLRGYFWNVVQFADGCRHRSADPIIWNKCESIAGGNARWTGYNMSMDGSMSARPFHRYELGRDRS